MKIKKILPFFFISLVFLVGFYYFKQNNKSEGGKTQGVGDEKRILFVGATCPHCKKVEEWLAHNSQVKEKSGLVIKEVYYDKDNAQKMREKAEECQMDTSQGLGVPFLFDQGECVIGDQPIIDYLAEKYNQ